jgi:ribosomal protein S18 acetylase RimI-like enzyme
MKLVSATYDDIPTLSAFASDIFVNYYTRINGIESATYMSEKFLSEEAIAALMDKGAIFRIAVDDDVYKGFCEYLKEDDSLFLSKLYVKEDYRGEGIGKLMFDDIVSYARNNSLKRVYLTINKHNTVSFEIYKHLGFTVIDSVVTDIGGGFVMDDYIMEYRI